MGRQSRIKVARRQLRATGASVEKPEAWKRANAVAAPRLAAKYRELTERRRGPTEVVDAASEGGQVEGSSEPEQPAPVTP